jgi:hypothetical protein
MRSQQQRAQLAQYNYAIYIYRKLLKFYAEKENIAFMTFCTSDKSKEKSLIIPHK